VIATFTACFMTAPKTLRQGKRAAILQFRAAKERALAALRRERSDQRVGGLATE